MIYCRWTDHVSIDPWTSEESVKKETLPVQETLGWLVHEDKSKICVALNRDKDNENVSCVMIINKRCIVERHDIKELVYAEDTPIRR